MSKRIEDSELQTLTLSPTNTNDDDSSPFVNPASDETSFPISRPPSYSTVTTTSSLATGEKRKLERIVSAPLNNNKPVPALRVSTPPGGSTRITYTNERSASDRKIDLSKISRDRPTPGNAMSQKKDVADVRQIEQGLLQLMEDFQAGNLRAFGKDSRLRQMETIREQQERLARLHFDVGAEQDLYPPLSEEGLRNSHDNMRTLMEKLAQLSESIERLQTNTTSSDRKCSTNERSKMSSHQMGSSSSGQGSTSSQHRMSSDHMNYPSGPHSSMFSQQLGDNVVGNRASDSAVMNNASPYSNLNNQVFSSSSHQSIPPISWRYNQGHHHTNSSANRPPRNAVDFQIGGMVMKGGKAAES